LIGFSNLPISCYFFLFFQAFPHNSEGTRHHVPQAKEEGAFAEESIGGRRVPRGWSRTGAGGARGIRVAFLDVLKLPTTKCRSRIQNILEAQRVRQRRSGMDAVECAVGKELAKEFHRLDEDPFRMRGGGMLQLTGKHESIS
jgi:hypothetical protein